MLWRTFRSAGFMLLGAASILLLVALGFWLVNFAVQFWSSPTTVVMYSGRKIVVERSRVIVYTPRSTASSPASPPPTRLVRDNMSSSIPPPMRDYLLLLGSGSRWERWGISTGRYNKNTTVIGPSGFASLQEITTTTVRIEYLIALGALGSALGWWLSTTARRRIIGRADGLCHQCGYDLRASTERCPECGTPIPQQASTKTSSPPSSSPL